MKTSALTLSLIAAFALAGCDDAVPSQNSSDRTITREQPKTPEEIAAQQAMMPKLREIASKGAAWDSLSAEDKAPFLEFQNGNEKVAQDYYAALVDTMKDIAEAQQ